MAEMLKTLNELIGDNAPLAVAVAFLVYIGTQYILAHFKHRADRRAYRYERSSTTGKMRFEKESFHIEQLSSALLSLVATTESLSRCDGCRLTFADKTRWMEAHRTCIACLGAAAPFINYLSPADGSPYCGVRYDIERPAMRSDEDQSDEDRSIDGANREQIERLRNHLQNRKPKSLYLRAALLVDACRQKMTRFDNVSVGPVLALGLFDFEEDVKAPAAISRELDLVARYERFVNCASCRLRDSETGSKDARWQRVKNWFASFWKWLFASVYHYFDPRCPYDGSRGRTCGKAKRVEVIRTVISSAVLIVGVCVLLLLFCRVVFGNSG